MRKELLVKWLFVGLISVLCAACSAPYSTNSTQQYLSSRNGPDLQVAPPLTRDKLSQFYVLPPQEQNAQIGVEPPIE